MNVTDHSGAHPVERGGPACDVGFHAGWPRIHARLPSDGEPPPGAA